jgi:hypothetical protein
MSGFTSGFGPSSQYSSSSFRFGALDGRHNAFRYPSQWWDVAHMELPSSVQSMFKWCRYHVLVNPLVSSVTKKMASYPITKVLVNETGVSGFDKKKKKWEDFLFRTINVNRFQVEAGLDYYTYGNCITSIVYPFHKYLECGECKEKRRIKQLRAGKDWKFRDFVYHYTCPACKHNGPAKVHDVFYKSYKDIRLVRWNPADIRIDHNPITQSTEYTYKIPSKIRSKVMRNDRRYLEETPAKFIDAIKAKRGVILTEENVFHFKAPTPSIGGGDDGWGYPPILPAMKDSFHLQIMKKANEAVMLEHLVPLDIIFPATGDANANPYTSVNLSDWKKRIEHELQRWRTDPNHKPILPLPVGYQRIGGNGRSLMLTNEIRAHSEHIVVGMGVPQEFAFGGLSWTGSSVSMRMLENQFLSYRDMHEHFLKHFLVPNVSRFMGWSEVSISMKAFKMADDVQNKQLLLSLNQMRKISDQTLLAEFDKDALSELRLIEQELRRGLELSRLDANQKARIQGEGQVTMAKYQTEAQGVQAKGQMRLRKEMQAEQPGQPQPGQQPGQPQPGQPQPGQQPGGGQPPGQQPGGGQSVNVIELADAYAKRLAQMSPQKAAPILQKMQEQNPQLAQLVQQRLATLRAGGQQGGVDMTPAPEKGAPLRGPGKASI